MQDRNELSVHCNDFVDSSHYQNVQAQSVHNNALLVSDDAFRVSKLLMVHSLLQSNPIEIKPNILPSATSITNTVESYTKQIDFYCNMADWDTAFSICKKLLQVSPENIEAYTFLGEILHHQGQHAKAIQAYTKAIRLRYAPVGIYSKLGDLYTETTDWKNAVSCYQKAIESNHNPAENYLCLAKVWAMIGNTNKATTCVLAAYKIKPSLGSVNDYLILGKHLSAANNSVSAIFCYQQAIRQAPDTIQAYQLLIDLFELQGDRQNAISYRRVMHNLTNENKQQKRRENSTVVGREAVDNVHKTAFQHLQELSHIRLNIQAPSFSAHTRKNNPQFNENHSNKQPGSSFGKNAGSGSQRPDIDFEMPLFPSYINQEFFHASKRQKQASNHLQDEVGEIVRQQAAFIHRMEDQAKYSQGKIQSLKQ